MLWTIVWYLVRCLLLSDDDLITMYETEERGIDEIEATAAKEV